MLPRSSSDKIASKILDIKDTHVKKIFDRSRIPKIPNSRKTKCEYFTKLQLKDIFKVPTYLFI